MVGSNCETKNYVWTIAKGTQNKSRGLAILISRDSNCELKDLKELGKYAVKTCILVDSNIEIDIYWRRCACAE